MIFGNKKERKIKLIKFNTDRSVQSIVGTVKKSIIEYEEEGWEARNTAFIEYNKDSLWGFQKAKIDNIKPCFVVRENDPAPLEFKKDKIYGDKLTPETLIYHEDESFSRKVSQIEETGGKAQQDMLIKGLVFTMGILAVCFLFGMLLVGIPGIPSLGG
tara:strand:- start:4033 stop:4506 length:474 start_codon:yes stop_codon:yes gene_type:complete